MRGHCRPVCSNPTLTDFVFELPGSCSINREQNGIWLRFRWRALFSGNGMHLCKDFRLSDDHLQSDHHSSPVFVRPRTSASGCRVSRSASIRKERAISLNWAISRSRSRLNFELLPYPVSAEANSLLAWTRVASKVEA